MNFSEMIITLIEINAYEPSLNHSLPQTTTQCAFVYGCLLKVCVTVCELVDQNVWM